MMCFFHRMARTKVAVRKKGSHSESNMLKALKLHRSGLSIRKAAKACDLKYPTFRRYVKNHLNVPTDDLNTKRLIPHYENRAVFKPEHEKELYSYLIDCSQRFYGLDVKSFRKIANQMAKLNKVSIPDSWERDQMAGK